jgi:hypothetical protein
MKTDATAGKQILGVIAGGSTLEFGFVGFCHKSADYKALQLLVM